MVGVWIYLKIESKSWADGLDAWCERQRGGKDDSQVWDCPSLRMGSGMKSRFGLVLGNSVM